jgi:hypothetical protein
MSASKTWCENICSIHIGLLLRAHIFKSDSMDCSDLLPLLGAAAAVSPAAVCTPVLNCLQVPTPALHRPHLQRRSCEYTLFVTNVVLNRVQGHSVDESSTCSLVGASVWRDSHEDAVQSRTAALCKLSASDPAATIAMGAIHMS